MSKLPTVTGKEAVRLLTSKFGYVHERTTGSHFILSKTGVPLISIPVHGNRDLKRGTLRAFSERRASQWKSSFVRPKTRKGVITTGAGNQRPEIRGPEIRGPESRAPNKGGRKTDTQGFGA